MEKELQTQPRLVPAQVCGGGSCDPGRVMGGHLWMLLCWRGGFDTLVAIALAKPPFEVTYSSYGTGCMGMYRKTGEEVG